MKKTLEPEVSCYESKQTNKPFHNWKNTKFAGMAVTLSILVLVIAVVLNMIVFPSGLQLGHLPTSSTA